MSKGGGKAFDIEVDVKDSFAFELLESINDITRSQRDVLETISTVSSIIEVFVELLKQLDLNHLSTASNS